MKGHLVQINWKEKNALIMETKKICKNPEIHCKISCESISNGAEKKVNDIEFIQNSKEHGKYYIHI